MPPVLQAEWSLEDIDQVAEGQEGQDLYELLTDAQRAIVDRVLEILTTWDPSKGKCIYISGHAGTGKSFTYRVIFHLVRAFGYRCIATASTGIASTILPAGRTWHSLFKLPVPITSSTKCSIQRSALLESTDVYILDEAPMMSRFGIECVDELLQKMHNKPGVPFGGKIVILGGDYRQTLPIQEGAVKSELLDLSLKSSPLWEHFKENLFTLTENIRLNADQEDLSRFQMSVGNGATNDGDEGLVVLPQQCYTDEDLITEAYADLIRGEVTQEALPEYLHGRCILAVLNSVCDEYNQRVMGLIPGDACTYTSVNRLVPDNSTSQLLEEMPPEVMESVNPSGLPPHELKLKVGAVVIVMRNLNVSESLCNGTRLLVTRLGHRVIEAVHISGSLRGKKVWIPRIKLPSNQSNAKLPFLFERTQFPIRPAFCLTINKSQGQTFDHVAVDLRTQVFSHGQLYVALSRVRSIDGLRVLTEPPNSALLNIVFKEVLQEELALPGASDIITYC